MTQDDRMETITDPALIRATDEPDERGDFPCCATPAPVGAAVALDLDAIRHLRSVGLTRREHVDALLAEVVTLRARLAEAEALHWKVGGACSHCSQRSDYAVAWPCETAVALAGTTGEGQ